MIDLEYIVKTSLMLLLKRIIGIFLIILLLTELVLLVLKTSEFFILLDRFLTMQYNISLYYWSGVFAVSYWFFYFVIKLLDFFGIKIWIRK
jgi:hypothetical protein